MDEKIKYWLDLAKYDLKTAKAMLDTKRYLYVGFMCHQTIEKETNFIMDLNPLNIESRYPSYVEKINEILTDTKCKELLSKTKELLQWIETKL